MLENKRRRSRLLFNIEIIVGAGSKYVFVITGARIPVGAICGIEIMMTGKSSNMRIRARGVIVRHASDGMGIAFQHDLEWWPVIENACMEQFEAQTQREEFSPEACH